MTLWLRLYANVLDDPKVQRLDGELFKAWINLLCLAKEGGGLLPPIEDIAFKLRTTEENAKRLTEALVKHGLLDTDGTNMTPHNWHARQFESDSSTERVKRHRNVTRNVTETLGETVPEQIQSRAETEPETEPETEQSRGGAGETPLPAASRAKPRSARAPVPADDEFLDGLQKNPAYSMLNVRQCYQRMVTWCQVNSRTPSRRRFINWLNKEDKPMTAPVKKSTGNAQVGKHVPAPAATPAETETYMAGYIETLIELDDWIHIGQSYDAIMQRGGPKAEWEIRCVAWFELHKDDPATPEQVGQLKGRIIDLANKR